MSLDTLLSNPIILTELKNEIGTGLDSGVLLYSNAKQLTLLSNQQSITLLDVSVSGAKTGSTSVLTENFSLFSSATNQVCQVTYAVNSTPVTAINFKLGAANGDRIVSMQLPFTNPSTAFTVQCTVSTFDGSLSLATTTTDYATATILQY